MKTAIQEPPSVRRNGYVYFVTDGDLIKIGHSYWPLNRFKDLKSPSGAPMELLAWFRGYMDDEHNLHRCFAALNVPGAHGVEWFRDDGRIKGLIEHCDGWKNHIFGRRVSILDVALGKMPETTQPDKIPTEPAAFMSWANPICGDWPADLQVKAGRYAYGSIKFEEFLDAYIEWFGPTAPFKNKGDE